MMKPMLPFIVAEALGGMFGSRITKKLKFSQAI